MVDWPNNWVFVGAKDDDQSGRNKDILLSGPCCTLTQGTHSVGPCLFGDCLDDAAIATAEVDRDCGYVVAQDPLRDWIDTTVYHSIAFRLHDADCDALLSLAIFAEMKIQRAELDAL